MSNGSFTRHELWNTISTTMAAVAHAQHPPHAAPPFSSTSDDTGTRAEEVDPGVDIGMLRELAKRSLIDALNSVSLVQIS
jgi:hypothetical protein